MNENIESYFIQINTKFSIFIENEKKENPMYIKKISFFHSQ